MNNWSYNTAQSNATTAKEVATKVSEIKSKTGAAKVNLITHSMGALSTRYYIKNLGGTSTIEDWVSLGGPNHGTTTANFCFETSCVEMRPNSTFLNALNAGTEVPPPVHYATWWSPCDEIINPHSSVLLTGAQNTETECISHVALTTNEKVFHAGARIRAEAEPSARPVRAREAACSAWRDAQAPARLPAARRAAPLALQALCL